MADTTTVTNKTGETKELPTTFLTFDEAELLRNYQRWGEFHNLNATMKCKTCDQPVEVYVQADIGFFCGCRVLLWRSS